MGSAPSRQQLEGLNVVVIGGGYAGAQIASDLKKAGVPFKLINKQEFFHHCVGALRASVFPEYGKVTAIPLKEAFGNNFIQGSVTKLDSASNEVVLESGERLVYSHCIIAVGSLGPSPSRTNQTTIGGLQSEYEEMSKKISKASKIVIVGGGPVGIELAGEIRDRYKDKQITLVHSNKKLGSANLGDKFCESAAAKLEEIAIKVVYGRVTNLSNLELSNLEAGDQIVTTEAGNITADLVISCVGLPPNRKSIEQLMPADNIDTAGRIKVNEYLQVEGLSNVFAVGDCCNTPEDKMAAYAAKHGELVSANILKLAQGRQMKPYSQPFVGMLVPVGQNTGFGVINGFNMPGFLVSRLKGQDLFSGKFWSGVGLSAPAVKLVH